MKAVKNQSKVIALVVAAVAVFFAIIAVAITSRSKQAVVESPRRTPGQAVVIITETGFMPEHLRITAGDTVSWINKDLQPHSVASNPHPSHDGLKSLFSEPLSPDSTYTYTFNDVGNFPYHDDSNPERNGVIEVVAEEGQ